MKSYFNQIKSLAFEDGAFLKFILFFVFAKASVFFAPLLLSNITTREMYGKVEYSLAIAASLSILLNVGTTGSYPYFIIKKKRTDFKKYYYFYTFSHLLIIGICIALLLSQANRTFILSVIIASNMAIQTLTSVIYKCEGNPSKAVIIESGVFIILMVSNLYFILVTKQDIIYDLILINLTYSIFFQIYYLKNYFINLKKVLLFSIKEIRNIFTFGNKILISSFLLTSLTGGGRILIEYFEDNDSVAIYAFYFRIASVVIILHQIINIFFFKKIYTSNTKKLDSYFVLFLVGISLISWVVYFISPFLLPPFFSLYVGTVEDYLLLHSILNVQMIFWVGVALNENIISRENLISPIIKILLLGGIFLIISLFILKQLNLLNIFSLAFFHCLTIFSIFIVQSYTLKLKRGITFTRTRFFLILNASLIFIIFVFHYI